MATLQNIGLLKYRGKDGAFHPLPVILQGGAGEGLFTISGKGEPTASTVGVVNQLYRDEDTERLYICVDAADGVYTWAPVSGGTGGASDWNSVSGKPFETIGEGLAVDSGKKLRVSEAVMQEIAGKVDRSTLQTAVDDALDEAKASGAFDGADGKSAYDIAAEQGFTGTAEEWIASLQGEDGVSPHIGDNGNWWIGDTDTGVSAAGSAGGTDVALGMSGASVGQIAKITAVDERGIPTSWEPVDFGSVYIGKEQPTDGTMYWLDTSDTVEEIVTYTVTKNLTNVTIDNTAETVAEKSSFSAKLAEDAGYTLSSVTITMGDADITNASYDNGNIYIASVTGNIVITAVAIESSVEVNTYTITNNLVNVTSNNSAVSVEENSSYTATLTAVDGYVLESTSVTMGGADVTADVYADCVINITSVTGDVVISAVAIEKDNAELLTNIVANGIMFNWNPNYNEYIIAEKAGVNLYEYHVTEGKKYAIYVSGIDQYTNPYVTYKAFSTEGADGLFAVAENKATDFTAGTHYDFVWDTNATVESVVTVKNDDGTYTKHRKFTPAIDGYMYVDDRCGYGLSVKEVME